MMSHKSIPQSLAIGSAIFATYLLFVFLYLFQSAVASQAVQSTQSVYPQANSPAVHPSQALLAIEDAVLIERDSTHMGRPVTNQSGRFIAVALIPAGTETVALGEIAIIDAAKKQVAHTLPGASVRWREQPNVYAASANYIGQLEVEQFATMGERRLIHVELSEQVPEGQVKVSSAGGKAIGHGDLNAVILAEQVLHDLDPSDLHQRSSEVVASQKASYSPTYPEFIRVRHHRENQCRNEAVGSISFIPFEAYVARVVSSEVPSSWPIEALKAQAVAVRTYAWYQITLQRPEFDVTDWADFQYMCDGVDERARQATEETANLYLTALGDPNALPIVAMYSAENGHPTLTNPNVAYLQAVPDLYALGKVRFGHGFGLSQWGAQRRASDGYAFDQILGHYYSGVHLRDALSPTTPLANFVVPPKVGRVSTDSIQWRAITSDPALFIEPANVISGTAEPTIRIAITASQPLTTSTLITTLVAISDTAPLTASLPLTHSVLITKKVIHTGTLFVDSVEGAWPIPSHLEDGDQVTMTLLSGATVLGQSVLTLAQDAPNPPAVSVAETITDIEASIGITTSP